MPIDPRADARDARFLYWFWSSESKHELSMEEEKKVWDAAWASCQTWVYEDSGRG